MSHIYTTKSFKTDLHLADRGVPDALVLLGASDAGDAVKQIKKTINIKNIQETAFPNIFTGLINKKLIAFGSTYATSFTADIVHAFTEIGVRNISFFGFCGAIQTKWKRGDIISPTTVHDGVGIFTAYGIFNKKINLYLSTRKENATTILTWHNLFSETTDLIKLWKKQNIDVVDLESSAIVATCKKRKILPHIRLFVADQLYFKEQLQKTYDESFATLCQKRARLIYEYIDSL